MKLIITIFILLALTLNNNAKNDSLYNNSNQIKHIRAIEVTLCYTNVPFV